MLLGAALLVTVFPADPAGAGQIGGFIRDEDFECIPDGRAEVYTPDGTLVTTESIGLICEGYQTVMDLPPGEYYVLLYNGTATTFVGWFPQWFEGAPLLRLDRASAVTVGGPNTVVLGIDARLEPMYEDMFDSVFFRSIAWMHDTAITQGCAPSLYCPDDFVTRGQMAAFLVRALFLSDDGGGNLFVDDDDSVFEGAIDRLGTAGITQGCNPPTNTSFCPDDFVTRGQMAAFLVRALGYTDDGGGNLFVDDNDSVFEGAIDRLGTAGVTQGCNPPTNNRFCPNDLVTRGQMAAFLKRALEIYYPIAPVSSSLAYATAPAD
jgi:hypothetical protein